jgi:hypothetical protein
MRRLALLFALLLAGVAASKNTKAVDFDTQIQPILKGTMYAKRPFDKPENIVALGGKLFTRIKAEKDRELIRTFIAEQKR